MGRLLLLISASGLALLITTQAVAYGFPFDDPLLATVVGTPTQYQAELPEHLPRRVLKLSFKPPAQISDIFWHAVRFLATEAASATHFSHRRHWWQSQWW